MVRICDISELNLVPSISACLKIDGDSRDAEKEGGAAGVAVPLAFYQEGQGGQKCLFILKDYLLYRN